MRVLIIEDDMTLRETLKANLEAECFAVDAAEDAERGLFLARTNEYDVVIVDYILPRGNGRDICVEIRKSNKSPYIIMVTVKNEVESKVDVLNAGADDYLTKPYSFQELMARIRALLRRPKEFVNGTTLVHESLQLDTRSYVVKRGEKEVYLTRKEFILLEYLLRHKGMVVSRGMLIEHVWDGSLDPFSNTIESHILTLRRKIDTKNRPSLIQTVPGRGYKIATKG